MSKLICPKCQQSSLKWLDDTQTIMKCQKRLCGAEFVGIEGRRTYQRPKSEFGLGEAIDLIAKTLGNMVVCRDLDGHPRGFGTTFVACLINTARRINPNVKHRFVT